LTNGLRQTGIIIQDKIPWGTHLCLFHETKEDLLDTMVPYFRAGLKNNEFCLWVLQPSLSRREALDTLRRGVPDFDLYLSEGRIEVLSEEEWYREGGKFELAALVEQFRMKLEQAISKGYLGLRANGSSVWLHEVNPITFGEYEKRLDDLIADKKMIVVCSFALREASAALVLDAACTHQMTAALRNGSWTVIEIHEAGGTDSAEQADDAVSAASHQPVELARLTPREQAVLSQIVAGASSKEAARRLGISPRTVEFHRANILQKLGAKNTVDLMRIVLAA
jgi:DNA-binding CsgD family transcriptional regulator